MRILWAFILCFVISACSGGREIKIVTYEENYQSDKSIIKNTIVSKKKERTVVAPKTIVKPKKTPPLNIVKKPKIQKKKAFKIKFDKSPNPIAFVRRSDTLYSLAKRYNVSMEEIVFINNLKAPYTLYRNQRLKLPIPTIHTVISGDTLYSIARKYSVSVSELARINGFSKTTILDMDRKVFVPKSFSQINNSILRNNNAEIRKAKQITKKAKYKKDLRKSVQYDSAKKILAQQKARQKQKIRLQKRVPLDVPKRKGRFIMPIKGKIISGFGKKSEGIFNDGINIASRSGRSVKASENGVVAYAGNGIKGFGNVVLIKHANSFVTVYAHLGQITIRRGKRVKQGAKIGTVGQTGRVKSPQVHFQIRKKSKKVNPTKYIR